MRKIAVIGAGTMGNGIAHTFAQSGYEVSLIDISADSLQRGINTIEKNLDRMLKREKISEDDKQNTLDKITTFTSMNDGVAGVDLVVEAATENMDIKLKIFSQLDELCGGNVILASNTSSISITKIASVTNRPDKVIGMHFMNPVPIMKLVEVINGKYTSSEVTKKVIDYTKSINKIPLTANDCPGFISNRILLPMINEAIEALDSGVSDVKSIDGIMRLGMGHPMGPLQLADLIGLDVCKSILEIMHTGLNNEKYRPSKLLIDLVNKGNLGVKSGEGFYNYSNTKKAEVVSKRFSK